MFPKKLFVGALFVAVASPALAEMETTPIVFSITGSLGYGETTISSEFDALITDDGGFSLLAFESAAGDFDSDLAMSFSYTDLTMALKDEFLEGDFTLIAIDDSTNESKTTSLSGFAIESWDGNTAFGSALAECELVGFVPETHEVTWSITLVPAPGTLAVLGMAALGRGRRRD